MKRAHQISAVKAVTAFMPVAVACAATGVLDGLKTAPGTQITTEPIVTALTADSQIT